MTLFFRLFLGFSHVVLWNVMNIKAITYSEAADLGPYFQTNGKLTPEEIMDEIHKILDSGMPIGFDALVAVAFKSK